ncbi:hypothetical protein EEL30_00100 (plasmid) [Brevibacillus laterosporus]|uniref:Uncharacterized protein n=1 Tax=Brevibacillus laterosporus TaxID=1465 RepID=A0A518V1S6_BRELA|nr:hypothetical protein EEL30_00100 [Brevibacillus laterosporus]
MIDSIISLSFSMYSNPGVYGVLLGSGVSRSAGIPTGWQIVLDLCRKLANFEKIYNPWLQQYSYRIYRITNLFE